MARDCLAQVRMISSFVVDSLRVAARSARRTGPDRRLVRVGAISFNGLDWMAKIGLCTLPIKLF